MGTGTERPWFSPQLGSISARSQSPFSTTRLRFEYDSKYYANSPTCELDQVAAKPRLPRHNLSLCCGCRDPCPTVTGRRPRLTVLLKSGLRRLQQFFFRHSITSKRAPRRPMIRRMLRSVLDRLAAERLRRRTVGKLPRLREYALEHCPAEKVEELRRRAGRRLVLAVVGGYSFLAYVELGYDWMAPYYNPNLLFDEVHYFQTQPTRGMVLDLGYPFHVHGFKTAGEVARVCRRHRVDVLRAYDANHGDVAAEAAAELNLPLIVSVH